ncbi:serine hydrolase domain-containing protein [Chryseobacterium gregarium]|uniref:serine hydrolase domain-containing protein n=1 Tax=Chryseobacterium gregarium TaxID=456299 RepID=UPI0004070FED|nr:serine hydrolase domain-containing protein [Chryseobacterium gregarium]
MNLIKICSLFFVIFFSNRVSSQKTPDSIDLYIKDKMARMKIPGLQLAVIRNGKLVKLSHYGLANIEQQAATKNSTVFSINSMTKAFVGVAVMQLQEQGKLKVDDPLSLYIKDMPAGWETVTIRQALSNVSGLPNNIDQKEQVLGDGSEESNWEAVKKLPVESAPGEKFSYNQTGYLILGRIITRLSGKHFTQFIEDGQFTPCEMTVTRFGDSNDIIPNSAGAYSTLINTDGKWINDGKLHNIFATFPVFFRTATGIISSAEDLSKWLIALEDGKLLHKKESLEELFTTTKLNNGHVDGFNKLTNGYALGWPTVVRDEHPAAAPVGGMRSALFVYPKDRLSIIILTNLQGSNPEWMIDEVAGYYIPDMKAENGFGLSPDMKLLRSGLMREGFQNIDSVYRQLKKKNKTFRLTEDEVNAWGYQLLGMGKKDEALSVFRLNTLLFPNSANGYDSYGEILETVGRRKEAVLNYRKSLELNPGNTNAADYLKGK